METKHGTYINLKVTDRVSLHDWRGLTRLDITETQGVTLEVSDIDTDEMLRGISYFLRNVAHNDLTETRQRILNDIATNLTESLKNKETTNASA